MWLMVGRTSGLLCPKYNKQKVKYSTEATVVRLVGGIQAMEMQAVVDEFYREFQIPRAVKAKKQKKE